MIKKIFKQIKFFVKNVIQYILSKIITIFVVPSKKNILIGSSNNNKDLFFNNTKYLFLFMTQNTNYNITYVCSETKTLNTLRKLGYQNVCLKNSCKAFFSSLKAKYWFYDFYATNVFPFVNRNSILINLWHGIPLKKMGYDDIFDFRYKFNKIQSIFFNYFSSFHNDFYVTNSLIETKNLSSCFGDSLKQFLIIGSPRLDVLLHDIPNAEMFMEEDFNKIKHFKAAGKKIFIYMPTFRDTGRNVSTWLNSETIKNFLDENNAVLVCKLHPFDKNLLKFKQIEEIYKMNNDSDIYPVLKYSDALISDYSSVAFDYLLLDRPIIYHAPDLQEYQKTCRGFYTPYEEFVVGKISYNEDELISAMQDVINGIDNYKEQRKVLRDKMFKYQDGKNCERVVEWIRSLDK